VSLLDPEEELRLLSADQKAVIQQTIQAAISASHAELAQTCARCMNTYRLSYTALRRLMDGQLPDYLAAVSAGPAKIPQRQRHRLTEEQKATLVSGYCETYSADKPKEEAQRFFDDSAARLAVPWYVLEKLVAEDKRKHAEQHRVLKALGAQQREVRHREAAEARQSAKIAKEKPPGMSMTAYVGQTTHCPVCGRDFGGNVIPRHGSEPRGCRGSGRIGVSLYVVHQSRREAKRPKSRHRSTSVRTVRGGLPGLGRRS